MLLGSGLAFAAGPELASSASSQPSHASSCSAAAFAGAVPEGASASRAPWTLATMLCSESQSAPGLQAYAALQAACARLEAFGNACDAEDMNDILYCSYTPPFLGQAHAREMVSVIRDLRGTWHCCASCMRSSAHHARRECACCAIRSQSSALRVCGGSCASSRASNPPSWHTGNCEPTSSCMRLDVSRAAQPFRSRSQLSCCWSSAHKILVS